MRSGQWPAFCIASMRDGARMTLRSIGRLPDDTQTARAAFLADPYTSWPSGLADLLQPPLRAEDAERDRLDRLQVRDGGKRFCKHFQRHRLVRVELHAVRLEIVRAREAGGAGVDDRRRDLAVLAAKICHSGSD